MSTLSKKDARLPMCWCGCVIDPNNDCCRAGHRVFEDDGEPLSTQCDPKLKKRR